MQLWCVDKNFHSAVRSHASVRHELLCALNRKDVFFFFFFLAGLANLRVEFRVRLTVTDISRHMQAPTRGVAFLEKQCLASV